VTRARGPIVLFDLDGTVLTPIGAGPGPGRTAIDRAVRELFGVAGATEGVRLSGNTDRGIARALLVKLGVDEHRHAPEIDRILAAYVRHFEEVLRGRKYRPIGDVARSTKALNEMGACVGLATGNVRDGARMKMTSAGVVDCFDLDRGGYGCDAEHRPDVLRVAVERCGGANGSSVPVIVVGDTMHDVSAARAIGAKVVGVAMNESARAELRAYGADVVVDDCGPAVVSAIKSLTP
jgi:phosphoglycolate phosphatase-like HAD superfamily hydrolase